MKAYPYMHKHPTSGQTTISEGMDLRDWFAGLAMQAIVTSGAYPTGIMFDTAKEAYEIADAMMKQREVKNEQP
jgi:hypothetical protein